MSPFSAQTFLGWRFWPLTAGRLAGECRQRAYALTDHEAICEPASRVHTSSACSCC
jgi:hypothetical protein